MDENKATKLKRLRKQRKELLEQKNWQEAIKIMQDMLAIEPSAERYINLASIQLKLKLHSEALQSFSQALMLDPNCQRAQDGITKVINKTKESATASEILERNKSDLKQILDDKPHSLGRYKIESTLGQGGMGKVYKAYDPKLKRQIAIKTLLQNENTELAARFIKEAESMAQLMHPNIIQIHDIGKENNQNYFTMNLIEGDNLATLIEKKKLTIKKSIAIIKKVATAIEFAHSKGIIHRDLKPSNIMINKDKEPVVMDFGLAVVMDQQTRLSKTGDVVGTPAYMAVEQILGKKNKINKTTDVYALGVILYEMLTGTLPFSATIPYLLMQQTIETNPIEPKKINKAIPDYLNKVCLKAMAKEQKKRYFSAKAFAFDLDQKTVAKTKSNIIYVYITALLAIAALWGIFTSKEKPSNLKSKVAIKKSSFSKSSSLQKSSSSRKSIVYSKSNTSKKSFAKKPVENSKVFSKEVSKKTSKKKQKQSKSQAKSDPKPLSEKHKKWLKRYHLFIEKYSSFLRKHKFTEATKEINGLLQSKYAKKKENILKNLAKDLKNLDLLFIKNLSKRFSQKTLHDYIPLTNGKVIKGKIVIMQKAKDKLYLKWDNDKYESVFFRDIEVSYLAKYTSKRAKQQFYLGMLFVTQGNLIQAQKHLEMSGKNIRTKFLLKQIKALPKPDIKILKPQKKSFTVSETLSTIKFQAHIISSITPHKITLKNNGSLLNFQNKEVYIRLEHGTNKIKFEVSIPFKILCYQKIAIYKENKIYSFSRKITRQKPKNLPMYRGNLQRTGYLLDKAIKKEPELLWSLWLKSRKGSPLIFYDNILYIGMGDGLHLVDAKAGKKLWVYKTKKRVSIPTINKNTIYFGCEDGHMYALDIKNRTLKWKFKASFAISSPVIDKGMIYFCTSNGFFYALNAKDGKIKWKLEKITPLGSAVPPAIAGNIVYWQNNDNYLYALNKHKGTIKWSFARKGRVCGTTIVDQTVCFGARNFYALYATNGKIKWQFKGIRGDPSAPAIAKGVVYFLGSAGYFYAISFDKGKLLWQRRISTSLQERSATFCAPVVVGDVVYCGDPVWRSFHALDAKSGNVIWQRNTTYMPPDINNQILYYYTFGTVYALK